VSRIILPLVALALLGALLGGCGDDDDDGGDEITGTMSSDATGSFADYDITGKWSGTLKQTDLPDFRVSADIRDLNDKFKNTVSYTGINCSGHWEYLGREGAAFLFEEVIDAGKGGNCKGKGNVTMTPFSDDGADYTFSGGGVESSGVVKRN
jgi:hypothetical protein